MPAYVWTCSCGTTQEKFMGYHDERPEEIQCQECGGVARRNFLAERPVVKVFQPFTDIHLTGKPIEVTSGEQHRRLMKQNGVRLQERDEGAKKYGWAPKTETLYSLPSATSPSSASASSTPTS